VLLVPRTTNTFASAASKLSGVEIVLLVDPSCETSNPLVIVNGPVPVKVPERTTSEFTVLAALFVVVAASTALSAGPLALSVGKLVVGTDCTPVIASQVINETEEPLVDPNPMANGTMLAFEPPAPTVGSGVPGRNVAADPELSPLTTNVPRSVRRNDAVRNVAAPSIAIVDSPANCVAPIASPAAIAPL